MEKRDQDEACPTNMITKLLNKLVQAINRIL